MTPLGPKGGRERAAALPLLLALLAPLAAEADEAPLVEAVQGTLRVTLPDGSVLEGEDLEGAELVLADGNQGRLEVRIEAVHPDEHSDLLLHDLRVRDAATGAWRPLCEPGPDGERLGLVLKGAWGADGTYLPEVEGLLLTCTKGVVAKCLRGGYTPWGRAGDGTPLLPAFQACTRMFRADYCGDGVGYTRDGTPINIEDTLGIQSFDPAPDLVFEAAWGPHGALCVHHPRIAANVTLNALVRACPRLRGHTGDACTPDAAGALLLNQSRP